MASRTGSRRGADAWNARVGGRMFGALGGTWLRESNWRAGHRNSLEDIAAVWCLLAVQLVAVPILRRGKAHGRNGNRKGPLDRRVIPPVVLVSTLEVLSLSSVHAAFCFFLHYDTPSLSYSPWLFSLFLSRCWFLSLFLLCSSLESCASSRLKWDIICAARRAPDENCCWPECQMRPRSTKPSIPRSRTMTGRKLCLSLLAEKQAARENSSGRALWASSTRFGNEATLNSIEYC